MRLTRSYIYWRWFTCRPTKSGNHRSKYREEQKMLLCNRRSKIRVIATAGGILEERARHFTCWIRYEKTLWKVGAAFVKYWSKINEKTNFNNIWTITKKIQPILYADLLLWEKCEFSTLLLRQNRCQRNGSASNWLV